MKKKGVILMEMLLALAIGSAILVVVSNTLVNSQQANLRSYQNQQAELYLQEISEIVKSLASSDWDKVKQSGTFYPKLAGSNWDLFPGEENLGIYQRKIIIEDVFRDLDGHLATQGGVLDPSTKKITASLVWQKPRYGSRSQSFFITRWQKNLGWIEDTLADFNDGFEDGTDVLVNPGSIQLAQTGGGGWSEPKSLGTVDGLTKASSITATSDYIYLGLDRIWGNVEVFDISSSPATPSSVGDFDTLYRSNDLSAYGNYLYISDDLFFLPSITTYNIGANPIDPPYESSNGLFYPTEGIWATNEYLFVGISNRNLILVYDLRDEPDEPQYLGSFLTLNRVQDIAVSGNYLYAALKGRSPAIEIFDISSSPTNPIHVGQLNTLYEPTGIFTEGSILYLSMEHKRGAMFSISLNPANPLLYGYFPTQRNTVDITASGDYGYVAGKDSRLKVIEIFDLSDSKGISGIYFVYGEYISSSFDAGPGAAFNRISWEGEEPGTSNILFQIATNNDNLTWNFVGPDGTAASYFEEPGAIPLNSTSGQFLKYKLILTSDGDVTPTVDKVTINYSS